MTDPVRLQRRATFTSDAERYARTRPTYPPALFDQLAAAAGLGPGSRVLEIAPGTGQATVAMAERGWAVTAVELGEQMADAARRALAGHPDATVLTAAFETWPLPPEPFDAVLCATAWHWLDPAVRVGRAAAALRPGGVLGVVWTHHVAGGTHDFFAAARECYRRFDPDFREDVVLPAPEQLEPSTGELAASGVFTDVQDHWCTVEITYSTAQYLDLLQSYSSTAVLPPDARRELLDCLGGLAEDRFGGRVTKQYVFELVLARTDS